MEEMKYKKAKDLVVLDMGRYSEFNYYIISRGTHPCAYIDISNESDIDTEHIIDDNCHYGETYHKDTLELPGRKMLGDFVGWDYAHAGDFMGFYEGDGTLKYAKKWTTKEIYTEIISIIDKIVFYKNNKKDLNNTRNYLSEKARMTGNCSVCNDNCPLYYGSENERGCAYFESFYYDKAIQIVQEWSKRHPKVLNKNKFHELFGYPLFCDERCHVCLKKEPCDDCSWWSEEYKETTPEKDMSDATERFNGKMDIETAAKGAEEIARLMFDTEEKS